MKYCFSLLVSLSCLLVTLSHRLEIGSCVASVNNEKQVLSSDFTDTLIVGSGLTGSTAAYYLNRSGVDIKLVEMKDYVGGNIITNSADGYQWEEGPNSFQPNVPILRFAKDLGVLDEIVLADPGLPRFVYWNSKLRPLPSGVLDIPTFSLLSVAGKVRAALGMFGWGVAPKPENYEESIREFTIRHLGEEVFKRLVDPFVSGVYAGDPNALSISAALKKIYLIAELGGSKGMFAGGLVRFREAARERRENEARDGDLPKIPKGSLGNFKRGMQTIPNKVRDILGDRVLLSHRLVSVAKEGEVFVSTFQVGDETKVIRSRSLVLTSPAYETSKVLGGETGLLPELSPLLDRVHYPPVAAAVLAYPNTAFKVTIRGFGHLIPRANGIRTLGTIWVSSLFQGRAPPGYTLLNNFIGGAQDPTILNLTDSEIVDTIHADNMRILLKPNAPRPKVLAVRMWKKAIPQYEKGHSQLVSAVQETVHRKQPGLFLGGNYNAGISIGDCVLSGMSLAKEITTYIQEKNAE